MILNAGAMATEATIGRESGKERRVGVEHGIIGRTRDDGDDVRDRT